jgi:hypothetical protein
MTSLVEHMSASRGLLKSLNAVTNFRAFLTVLGTLFLCMVSILLFDFFSIQWSSSTAAMILKILRWLDIALVFTIGFSVAGIIVNDQMRGRPPRTLHDAVFAALLSLPRLIGMALLIGAAALVIIAGIFAVLFICKIPYVGPVLYVAVFPLSVIIIGVGWYAAFFVLLLSAPSIWEGNCVTSTMRILCSIIHTRLRSVIIHLLLLTLLVGTVAVLVMGGLTVGMMVMAWLSENVLHIGSIGVAMAGFSARAVNNIQFGNGYLIADVIGCAILMVCAMVLPALVALAGNCIVFANVSQDVSGEKCETGGADCIMQKVLVFCQRFGKRRTE